MLSVEEQVFDESFRSTMGYLEAASTMTDFCVESVQRELESLCKYEGLDWTGRGELKQAEIAGSIAAYQAFLHRWRRRAEVEQANV